jgi:hypothetical protein
MNGWLDRSTESPLQCSLQAVRPSSERPMGSTAPLFVGRPLVLTYALYVREPNPIDTFVNAVMDANSPAFDPGSPG